jgi:chemotaxis protein MotA
MADATTAQGRSNARTGRAGRGKTARAQLDYATILGVAGAFALIVAAMIIGGTPGAFVDLRGFLIVIAGTTMVTTISYSFREMLRALAIMGKAMIYQQRRPSDAAMHVLYLADVARKQGALALQNHERSFRRDPFLSRAMKLVIDGSPGEEVERVMMREAQTTLARHEKSAGILRRAGEVSPAMGLIGTLIGLIQMLGRLENPSTIGPAMAVALLTTFYGAVLAHMLFLPIANKLERNASNEATVNQIYAQGAASVARQENPRRLETYLNTLLPPAERVSYFD